MGEENTMSTEISFMLQWCSAAHYFGPEWLRQTGAQCLPHLSLELMVSEQSPRRGICQDDLPKAIKPANGPRIHLWKFGKD